MVEDNGRHTISTRILSHRSILIATMPISSQWYWNKRYSLVILAFECSPLRRRFSLTHLTKSRKRLLGVLSDFRSRALVPIV